MNVVDLVNTYMRCKYCNC